MPLTVRILLCTIGVALLFLSSFVYEDGEKNIQSRLEDYWIKIDEQRIRSLATEKHILARLGALATRVLDGLLGKELVSLRALITSTAISWSSFLLVFPLVLSITKTFFHRPLPITYNPFAFILNALWAILLILLARKHTWVAIPLWIAPIIYMVSRAELMHVFPPETVIGISIGFALSVAADLLISVVARLLFRKVAALDNLFISTVWCSSLLVMAVAITYGPILANDQWVIPTPATTSGTILSTC